jgi:DNA-binding NarL/FixJ family response regulator
MTERLTVILVEDAYLVQSGIQTMLEEFPSLKLQSVFDGTEKRLAEKIIGQNPDIVLIDPRTLEAELLGLLRQVDNTGIQVIGLVDEDTPANVESHFTYVLNLHYCKYDLLEKMKSILGKRITTANNKMQNKELSEREKTILTEVVLGLTNQEIADKLFLSIHTVTTHRKNLTNKLGIKTVSGLTVYALINKLVNINDIEQK